MNDRPDEPDSSTSEEETPEIAEVRRLLADARHTEPMPDDVATRMSRLIERLGDETTAPVERSRAAVISIEPHRRRRAAGLLVAAAAIVTGGVVLSQNLGSTGDSSASTAGVAADSGDQAPEQTQDFNGGATPGATGSTESPLRSLGGRVVVRPRHFSRDALKAQAFLAQDSAAPARDALADCAIGRDTDSTVLPARYRNARAALVFRQPQGSSQVVFLYVCGSDEPVKTTTLPAP